MSKLYTREKTAETANGIPIYGISQQPTEQAPTRDNYRIRVEKFIIADDEDTCIQLEGVLNRALLVPSSGQPDVILLDRKESFFEGVFYVVLTYMERKA